jgi:hypothetical protein
MKQVAYVMAVLLGFASASAAYADDVTNTAAGAIIGGVAGAVIGNNVGGKKGAAIGAAIGGVTGAVIGSGKRPPLPPHPPLPGEVGVPVPPLPGIVQTQQVRREGGDEDEGWRHRRHHYDRGHHYGERERYKEHGYREDRREYRREGDDD